MGRRLIQCGQDIETLIQKRVVDGALGPTNPLLSRECVLRAFCYGSIYENIVEIGMWNICCKSR